MFDWLKKRRQAETTEPAAPEIIGLRLGGAFELDDLKLRLTEPSLMIEGAARTQLIQAVGEVWLDEQTRLVRYYTDDEGFVQVLAHGAGDADVSEVKLFYFFDSKPVDTDSEWQHLLDKGIVKGQWQLEDFTYQQVWENSRPVAMTEKTWLQNGTTSSTDQFVMVYERDAEAAVKEVLLVSAEEKIFNNRAERSLVLSTGFDLSPTDFKLIG
ncbi:YjfK family protein [Photobacterium halotolerans]|uniref:YjfK family protein n=1 Tax=Photobacterium halotolerans TaxID=265726 RepID=UPI00040B33B4|nr:YjfK family protein [Photobacterium halotolerans]